MVVASRANYGRKATMQAIKEHPNLELQVVVGASTYYNVMGEQSIILKKMVSE